MEAHLERRREAVELETTRYRVSGTIMLPPEGYKSRLSDHLNEAGREFLIILDATLTPFDEPEGTFDVPVMMLQRTKVDIIFPVAPRN
jgi:hypothetical protein